MSAPRFETIEALAWLTALLAAFARFSFGVLRPEVDLIDTTIAAIALGLLFLGLSRRSRGR